MARISPAIDRVRDGYAVIMVKILRLSIMSMVLVVLYAVGAFGLLRVTPTGFFPEEDQGAFFISVQLPDGASLNRTSDVVRQVEGLLATMPQVRDTVSVIGFSILDSAASSNNAFMIAQLKPFSDRTRPEDSAEALIAKLAQSAQQIRAAAILLFNLPPVVGLSTTGGFEYHSKTSAGVARQRWAA